MKCLTTAAPSPSSILQATKLFVLSVERGAKVADIAILVVSAEDGVKPQTIEALKCILKKKFLTLLP
jgi:translation elongation factor EF-1alpha